MNKPLLLCGNCFDLTNIISDKNIDAIITSPPYNRKRNDKYNNFIDVNNNYFHFLQKSIDICLSICRGNVFFNIQKNSYNRVDVHKIMGHFAEYIIEVIIWHKINPTPNPHLINAYEYILVLSKENKSLKANKTYTFNHFSTPVYSSNPYKSIHRAVMHPDACKYLVSNFTKEGDVICDPFMGVGTTGVICRELNRGFIGIELNKKYYQIAEKRIINKQGEIKWQTEDIQDAAGVEVVAARDDVTARGAVRAIAARRGSRRGKNP